MMRSVTHYLGCVAASALVAAVPARGQGAETAVNPTAAAIDSKESQLEEIVVTAQHRKENIQEVPIAVAAFSAAQAEKAGITGVESLSAAVPGLDFTRQGPQTTPFLRGVGNTSAAAGNETEVAFYIDDVYYASGAASLANFNNVGQVEVEKGPQGTLFGRNATGGVVQVSTLNPTLKPTADVSIGYANYNTKSGSIYASGAISDQFAANIAVYGSRQRDGWGRNIATGAKVYTGWDYGGRIKFLWSPSDDTSVLLTLDEDTTYTQEGIAFNAYPGTKAGLGGVPGFATPPAPGFYDINSNQIPYVRFEQRGASLKVTHDFDWAQLVSISAYRYSTLKNDFDFDIGPLNLANTPLAQKEQQRSQEIRLLSPKGSPLTWIAGVYAFGYNAGYKPSTYGGILLSPISYVTTSLPSDSYSGFGQATATVMPDTHLTIGLRYTVDERTLKASSHFIPPGSASYQDLPLLNSPQSKSWEKLTYRFALDHQFTPDIMGYVAYNRGYKSGTFNTILFAGQPISPPVQPETLDAYTIGAKTEWFNQRLRLNSEAFWYTYRNLQVTEYLAGTAVLVNAAAATIKGIDVDLQLIPVNNLTLTASAEALNGRYDSFPNGPLFVYDPVTGGNITRSANLAGFHAIHTPPFSFSTSVSYEVPTEEHGDFNFNVSLSHNGNYFFLPDNGAGQLSPSVDRQRIVDLVNVSGGWLAPDGAWEARIWGKNITGQKYFSYAIEDAFTSDYSAAPPATFGVTLKYHFGS